LLLQAGLGIANAISSKKDNKRFAGEVLDDETVDESDAENNAMKDNNEMQENNQSKKQKKMTLSEGNKTMNFYITM